jgi:AcrR family transcriptional regulator
MYTSFTWDVNTVYTDAMIKLLSIMPEIKKAYHHGDLRDALLEAGERMLEREGPAGLSLRKLGRELGVTPGAPYRHFEDKDALLAALAAVGYRRLFREMQRDIESITDGEEQLKRTGVGYLRFATAQPELFRLMFGWTPTVEDEELHEAAEAAHLALEGILRNCEAQGRLRLPLDEAGLMAWSAVHGAAFLLIDGRLKLDIESQNAECVLEHLHKGIWYGIGIPND